MAYGDRGPEPMKRATLGNGTTGVSSVPGDGKVKKSLPDRRIERSAANYSKPQEERFGS